MQVVRENRQDLIYPLRDIRWWGAVEEVWFAEDYAEIRRLHRVEGRRSAAW